ncbi:MAG: hypothetical protein AAFV88_11085, partial [Planctomycetota bacterium]
MMHFTKKPFECRRTPLRRSSSTSRHVAVVCCACLFVLMVASLGASTVAASDLDSQLDRLTERAETRTRENSAALALDCISMARHAKTELSPSQIEWLYTLASDALLDSQPQPDQPAFALVTLATANYWASKGNHARLLEMLTRTHEEWQALLLAIKESGRVLGDQPQLVATAEGLVGLTMRTAWHCLTKEDAENANRFYELNLELLSNSAASELQRRRVNDVALSELGLGWSLAMQPQQKKAAARQLERFMRRFPKHGDAPTAGALAVQCHLQCNETAAALAALEHLMRLAPTSVEVSEGLLKVLSRDDIESIDDLTALLAEWLDLNRTRDNVAPTLAGKVFVRLVTRLDADQRSWLLKHMRGDTTGQVVTQVLVELDAPNADSENHAAEALASEILPIDSGFPALAREAACRWAGRTARWHMLATQAKQFSDQPLETRSVHVDRLYAEALTREGDGELAYQFWQRVVDQGESEDFPTLLRCAELAVAHAPVQEAKRRLDRAESAIGDSSVGSPETLPVLRSSSARQILVELLRGDLAVRQADFTVARRHFESVVRASAGKASLRGRAQWMIGETHLMQ